MSNEPNKNPEATNLRDLPNRYPASNICYLGSIDFPHSEIPFLQELICR